MTFEEVPFLYDYIRQACKILKQLPDNKYETFQYLCALNLFNSLIKTPCFKREIHYKEIKLKVSDLIVWCSTDR